MKFKELLATPFCQRLFYEIKSFLITFTSVFALLIAPQLVKAVETPNYSPEFFYTLLGGVLVAGIRSMFITLLKLIGVDYRVDTSNYTK